MSSKRSLYQPVHQQNVGTKEKRKSLAQGRLVTGASLASGGQAELAQGMSDLLLSPQPSTLSDDLGDHARLGHSTPRRAKPNFSQLHSPRQPLLSKSLELSDTEDEILFSPTRTNKTTGDKALPNVMVVDASRQTAGPDTSEIDIRLGFTHSPAKVICHSPSAVLSSLSEKTGDVERSRRIDVDPVPSVNLKDSDVHYSDIGHVHQQSPPRHKSPIVIKENTIAGGILDPSSSAKPEIAKPLFSSYIEETGQVEQVPQYPAPRVVVQRHDEGSSLESIYSEVSTVSDISPVEQKRTNPPKPKSVVITTEDIQDKIKKKKRGTKVIESRYMRPASAKQGPLKVTANKSRDLSGMLSDSQSKHMGGRDLQAIRTGGSGKREPPKPRTGSATRFNRSRDGTRRDRLDVPEMRVRTGSGSRERDQGEIRSILTDGGRKYRHNRSQDFSEIRSIKSAGGPPPPRTNRSTPKVMSRGHDTSADVLGSSKMSLDTTGQSVQSITGAQNILDLSEIPTVGHGTHSHPDNTMLELSDFRHTKKGKKAKTLVDKQQELDLLYNRYLQFVFLNAKAKKSFQEQEKSALTQMHGLWEENERLQQRKGDLQQQLMKLQHLNKVDEALHRQLGSLGPVSSSLDKLEVQYKTLAQALDTTRHQIPTKGIYIPDNQDQYQEQLKGALEESEQLLGELSVMIRQQEPNVTEFSNAMVAMETTLDKEVEALNSCQELLSAAESLTMNEASLSVQDIQLKN